MHTNDNEGIGQRSSSLRLFEISFATAEVPVSVIAADSNAAINMAIEHQGGGRANPRSVLVWDATDAWEKICQIRQGHTDRALAEGTVSIAHYDDEEGWRVTPVSPG